MNETDLTLEILGKGSILTPLSLRGCTQTLTPLGQDVLRRTINGVLVCVSSPNHRKFQSTISCKDKAPPAFDGLWKGTRLNVGCIQYMTQSVLKGTQQIRLEREAVACYLYENSGKVWEVKKEDERVMAIPFEFPGGFLTYRPLLNMLVKDYHLETDEWGLAVGWKLELEEE